MSGVSGARVVMRRMIVSALAGGGLTVAGLGAPSALAADPSTGLEPPGGTTSTPEPEVPTQTTTTSTTPTSTATETTTTPAPAVGPSTTTSTQTTTAAQTPTSTIPISTTQAPKPRVRAPKVVVERTQETTEAQTDSTTTVTTSTPAPASTLPKGTGNIAAAPQLAAAQSNALAAMMAGTAASIRALDFYRIPLFLLPIYQAAAVQYGVPWPVLAAINEVETNFGTDQSVSTAGAVGWMQFMPETWLQYGVDAVNAGYADPYNPVDAIFAAARYLHAAGASSNLRAAILAYNHSEAYVESVLLRAHLFASYPPSVIATLTGLTEGRLPVAGAQLSPLSPIPQSTTAPSQVVAPFPSVAASTTAGIASTRPTTMTSSAHAALPGATPAPSPAASAAHTERVLNAPAPPSQLSELLGRRDAPVLAVEDGRVVGIGASRKLGKYVVLRDTYGDLFTYAGLGSIASGYRLPKPAQMQVPKGALQSTDAGSDPTPKQAATGGRQLPVTLHVAQKKRAAPASSKRRGGATSRSSAQSGSGQVSPQVSVGKVRVFAHPGNPDAITAARIRDAAARRKASAAGWMKLGRGSVVAQGTVLGHLGSSGMNPQSSLRFAIRPTGAQSAIDPRPILANWKQLAAALHPQGAKGEPVLAGATASDAFLLSQPELERAVLADPGIRLGACDRAQIASGKVSGQALALLVFLSRSGLKPTVGELRCGHAVSTAKGPRTVFPSAGTVDIAAINAIPIAAHQGAGTISDITIRTLLTLRHRHAPKRIFSLMAYPGAPSTIARPDHSTYIQIELPERVSKAVVSKTGGAKSARAASNQSSTGPLAVNTVLNSIEWQRLMTQVGSLRAPKVARKPSISAIGDKPAAPGNGGLGPRALP
jgi:soluble lytic murein transglycosylase-like protein